MVSHKYKRSQIAPQDMLEQINPEQEWAGAKKDRGK